MLITVVNYWNVQLAMQESRPDAVISIMDAAHLAPKLALDSTRHLRLGYHDIERPEDGKMTPSPEQMRELITFAQRHRADGAASILIHCMAGVSRSPAAAYILAVTVRQEDPLRAAHVLFREAPFANPNMLMIRHADLLAGLGKGMAQSIGVAREGVPQTTQQHSFSI